MRQTDIDYLFCDYGAHRVSFRGPQRVLSGDYVACVGSTEVFGRYVQSPFPDLLEDRLGLPCANFGVHNAGPDLFLADPVIRQLLAGSKAMVLQAMPAQNLSNPFYRVHPKRNDRFLKALPPLEDLYPEVDYTEIHFTSHLLQKLAAVSTRRFALVADALNAAWLSQMAKLIATASAPVLLLSFEGETSASAAEPVLPPFAPGTFAQLAKLADDALTFDLTTPAQADRLCAQALAPRDAKKAAGLPGGPAHALLAERIEKRVRPLLRQVG